MTGKTKNKKFKPVLRKTAPEIACQPEVEIFGSQVGRSQQLGPRQSKYYQLKTGHTLTDKYLQWTTGRPDAKFRWCQYKAQTREHLSRAASSGRANRRPFGPTS